MCNPLKYKLRSVCILCIEPLYVHLTPGVEILKQRPGSVHSADSVYKDVTELRERFDQKWESCHHLLTLRVFQTHLNCFCLYNESHWGPKQHIAPWLSLLQVWNNTRLSEWWQNLNNPFNGKTGIPGQYMFTEVFHN